jgi:Family of unknown function (DUF6263)
MLRAWVNGEGTVVAGRLGLARGPAWLAAVSAVVALSGCGGGSGSGIAGGPGDASRHVKDASSDVTCGADLRVDVIDNGASPRHPMVMKLPVGQQESTHSTIDVTSTSEASDGDSPSKSATVASGFSADIIATVDQVFAEAIKMSARYENLSTATPGGQSAVDELKHAVTQMRVSPKGRLIDDGQGKGPSQQQLTAFLIPFPDEDVGQGARWQAWSPLDAAGIKMCFLNTYTLSKFDGRVYEMTGDTKIVVVPGKTQQEKLGMTITLESRGGDGTGTLRSVGSLTSFYPESGETTSSLKFTVASSAQGLGEFVLTTDQTSKSTFIRLGAG